MGTASEIACETINFITVALCYSHAPDAHIFPY